MRYLLLVVMLVFGGQAIAQGPDDPDMGLFTVVGQVEEYQVDLARYRLDEVTFSGSIIAMSGFDWVEIPIEEVPDLAPTTERGYQINIREFRGTDITIQATASLHNVVGWGDEAILLRTFQSPVSPPPSTVPTAPILQDRVHINL